MSKISLKAALGEDRLDEFVREHEGAIGRSDAFDATLRSMAGKSKEAPEASPPDCGDD